MKTTSLIGLFCFSMVALAQDVQYNYDQGADFTKYKTYQWVDIKAAMAANPLVHKDIRRAVDAELAKKGLQKVENNGDLQVAYQAAIDKEKQLNASTFGPRWSGMAQARTTTIEIGKLVLDAYDPAQKQLVWRGGVSKTLDIKKDPEKNYKNLEKAVAKLLENFPPKLKK